MKTIITFRDWEFEIDRASTRLVYDQVNKSGAESCGCSDCRNYIANRHSVFPQDVRNLFVNVGIDYTKEVDVSVFENKRDGSRFISGFFHFLGRLLRGKDYRRPSGTGGFSIELTPVNDKFSIGFAPQSSMAYFDRGRDLVQIDFTTVIPWVLAESP